METQIRPPEALVALLFPIYNYQRILPTLLINPNSIFQQDNASTHTARIVREFVAELGREIMIWPPCSPDLNPIENLWTLLKQKIYDLRPDLLHMANNTTTLDILMKLRRRHGMKLI